MVQGVYAAALGVYMKHDDSLVPANPAYKIFLITQTNLTILYDENEAKFS